MATVILGAGIIGVSTAFYLSESQTPSSIHLVEPSPTLFASASGYAGGFLAKDWFGLPAAELGALSFAEHQRLAEAYGGREQWGYSRSTAINYVDGANKTKQAVRGDAWLREGTSRADAAAETASELVTGSQSEPSWLTRVAGDEIEVISEEGNTAQVDPKRLCEFLLAQCLKRGVQLHHPAKAISVSKDMRDELSNIRVASTDSSHEVDVPCTKLIITAGAWSSQVFEELFPASKIKLPISSLAGHSLVVRSPRLTAERERIGCHAIFTTDSSGFSPELFSRIGGEIYIAGANSSAIPLPNLATESKIDDGVIQQLVKISGKLLGLSGDVDVDDLEVVRKGLCFRPVTVKGTPIITRLQDEVLGGGILTRGAGEGGVFLAAGHGPWGISMSLGTGKVLAEMVLGLPTSASVQGLGL